MNLRKNIAAIVLAAGKASRFVGAQSQESKLAAPIQGRPLVRHAVDAALACGATPVIVVTGHAREKVLSAIADASVLEAFNGDYAMGMASSLRVGLKNSPKTCHGALIFLGDMPFVPVQLAQDMIAAFTHSDADAVVPVFSGQRANPVLLGATLFAEAQNLSGDEGARKLLRSKKFRVLEMFVNDAGAIIDIDTQADLARNCSEPL